MSKGGVRRGRRSEGGRAMPTCWSGRFGCHLRNSEIPYCRLYLQYEHQTQDCIIYFWDRVRLTLTLCYCKGEEVNYKWYWGTCTFCFPWKMKGRLETGEGLLNSVGSIPGVFFFRSEVIVAVLRTFERVNITNTTRISLPLPAGVCSMLVKYDGFYLRFDLPSITAYLNRVFVYSIWPNSHEHHLQHSSTSRSKVQTRFIWAA